MAEEILLDYVVNQPNVSSERDETELKVLMKVNASNALRAASSEEVSVGTHLALVLDVSSSMKMREIDALKQAARSAIENLRPGDIVSVIAFQSVVYEVVEPTPIQDRSTIDSVKQKIDVIDQFQGGGTDMEYALTKAEHHLSGRTDLVRKIILFTDGQVTGNPSDCLARAAEISGRGIGIDALGFGEEFDYKFMQRLVSYSNGFTTYVERPEDIMAVFQTRSKAATNAVATEVRLDLTFTPQVRANRGYRYSPEIAYLGKMKLPGDVRTISIPIGSIERDKEYAYLLTITVPKRDAGNVRIVKAELTYNVPSLGIEGGTSSQSVVINYTNDDGAIAQINGEVERGFDEVEIGRLIEELDASMDKKDHEHVAMLFDILSERYRELGDQAMSDHYHSLKAKYAEAGQLTQAEMNYNRHKSTQKRDSGVQLVDASSLI